MKNVTYIAVELPDKSRPKERPPKSNWKLELIKTAMKALQHASPRKVAEVVWHYFTMPGEVFFSANQTQIMESAEKSFMYDNDKRIATYKWGQSDRKILLCHGWRSKSADFRNFIKSYLGAGFEVHAIDMPAHGHSEGKHTALPEFKNVIKKYILKTGKFDIVLGYSLGGIAASVVVSELNKSIRPERMFIISAPPYIRFFFKNVIKDLGLTTAVYKKMANMVGEVYPENIDYYDMRDRNDSLQSIEKHLIYCEDDEIIPFAKGIELFELLDNSHFVQARGFGHYKIISHHLISEYLLKHSMPKPNTLLIT